VRPAHRARRRLSTVDAPIDRLAAILRPDIPAARESQHVMGDGVMHCSVLT
jgi:hypothetical protein